MTVFTFFGLGIKVRLKLCHLLKLIVREVPKSKYYFRYTSFFFLSTKLPICWRREYRIEMSQMQILKIQNKNFLILNMSNCFVNKSVKNRSYLRKNVWFSSKKFTLTIGLYGRFVRHIIQTEQQTLGWENIRNMKTTFKRLFSFLFLRGWGITVKLCDVGKQILL